MRAIVLGLSVIILVLFAFLISSCAKKQIIAENDVKFDTINVAKYHHLNNDSTLPSCNLSVILLYPIEYKDKDVLEKMQKLFVTGMFDEGYLNMPITDVVDEYSKSYIKSYTKDAERYLNEKLFNELESRDKYFSYYEDLSNSILFNKADIMSLQFVQSSKKGNNSTFRQFSNYVLNLVTGEIVAEADIFNEGYEQVLNRLFKDKLLMANNVKNISDLEDLGYFGIEEIMPNNNFLVDENGITYIFNKGEYSVLQSDEIRIFISYEEIPNVLKEKSPISVFYKI